MALAARSARAFLVAVLGPLLYLTHDRVTLPLPDAVAPVLPPVHRLQQYLRIRTDHPAPAYAQAVHFLNHTVSALLPPASVAVHTFAPGKPLLLVTLPGARPALPAVLLNSHTDVVPAEPPKWRLPPFAARAAVADGQLRVYARGAQDMKSVGLQYVEALAELLSSGWRPLRTLHLSFVPDEEIGGRDGMGRFVRSPVFAALNVGVALDEGLPNPHNRFNVYYGERQTWWLAIRIEGSPGHGATLPEATASGILLAVLDRVHAFRRRQLSTIADGSDIGNVVGVNVAYLKAGIPDDDMTGGHVMNVIPSVAEAGLDIRVPPTVDAAAMEREIDSWMSCEGQRCPGLTYDWAIKVNVPVVTSRDPQENPFIRVFRNGLDKAGILDRLRHGIFPAATDSRYLRNAGIPCFGFSPIENTPDLLHKHNEFISVEGYMQGCRIYKHIIKELADYDPDAPSDAETADESADSVQQKRYGTANLVSDTDKSESKQEL